MKKSNGNEDTTSILPSEKRKEIASKGGRCRWLPKATHQGDLVILDKKLPCLVLESGVRLLTQASIFKAFNRPNRGTRGAKGIDAHGDKIPAFLDAKNLISFISEEFNEVIKPIKYLTLSGSEAIGYKAEIIPVICELYLTARQKGVLASNQVKIAELSEILVRSLSKVGIIALIDEATGYQEGRPRDALQSYLDKVLRSELAAWSRKFPDEFYENIYKLKKWPWLGMSKNRYSCIGYYTSDLIYSRLGAGVIDELKVRSPKNGKRQSSNRLHQWLTDDIGHPMLSQHIHSIIMFQRLAIANGYGWKRFIEMVDLTMPKKGNELLLNGGELPEGNK